MLVARLGPQLTVICLKTRLLAITCTSTLQAAVFRGAEFYSSIVRHGATALVSGCYWQEAMARAGGTLHRSLGLSKPVLRVQAIPQSFRPTSVEGSSCRRAHVES